jgi:cell division protein FtsW (lipid II flippase)
MANRSGRPRFFWRTRELLLLLLVYLIAAAGFVSVAVAAQYRAGADPTPAIVPALLPLVGIIVPFTALHVALSVRRVAFEQMILPITALIFVIGAIEIYRLRGTDGISQQILRGLVPGTLVSLALLLWAPAVERVRRYAVPIGLAGLLLLFLTSVVGVRDETGARLSLKLGPLPAVQTSELIKVALIIFMAWYIEREGRAAEGRATTFLFFRLPSPRYIIPAALFVGAATLALVAMSDFGAVLILGALFIAMLFSGFETRIFATIATIGMVLGAVVGLVLSQVWTIPATIQNRYLAFRDPWSGQLMPNGYTIAEGPGYQIQQSIYAVIAGGVTGAGLGLGSPTFVPLAHSDFILAAIIEEMGSAVGVALLALYAVLIQRLFRVVLLMPRAQVFERLLLVGIGVHLFAQVFIMSAGTLDLIPLTGVTLPFLSLGGVALMVNLIEVSLALAIMQRVEGALA